MNVYQISEKRIVNRKLYDMEQVLDSLTDINEHATVGDIIDILITMGMAINCYFGNEKIPFVLNINLTYKKFICGATGLWTERGRSFVYNILTLVNPKTALDLKY
ncbi:MAG TPA: hypothetical protein EYN54_09550 [Methylococcaceae bacterium]|nr:hypothetical protein [Methylococcaceae bacterium]HIO13532.1 hypothetical protein [Methylococcales bacterium]